MKSKKTLLIIIAIVVIIGLIIGINIYQSSKEPEVIKIGAILPLTGELSMFGNWLKEGIFLAVKNYESTSNNYKFEVIFEDNMNNNSFSVSAFNKLVQIDKVKAIITARTPVAYTLSPLATKREIPMVFTFADLPENVSNGIINFHFPLKDEVTFLANIVPKYIGKRGCILTVNDEFGQLASNLFESNFDADIIFKEKFSPLQTDFKTIINKIPKNIDFIFVVGYGQNLSSLIKSLAERKITVPLVSINSFTVFFDLVKEYLIMPVYIPTTLFNVGQENKKLYKDIEYKFKLNFNKTPNLVNLESYEATIFLLKTLEKHKLNYEQIIKDLKTPKNIESVFGNLKLDYLGQVHFPLVLVRIFKGQEEIITIWRP